MVVGRMHVGNLPLGVPEAELRELLERTIGPVRGTITMWPGKSFAFVLLDEADLERAIASRPPKLRGKDLRFSRATPSSM